MLLMLQVPLGINILTLREKLHKTADYIFIPTVPKCQDNKERKECIMKSFLGVFRYLRSKNKIKKDILNLL